MPEISIILPAFNAEALIGQSIESVMDQSFQDWELLVVDAGSGDETAAVVKRYAQDDLRVQYIRRREPGLARARNAALARIPLERPYLAFIDSGDIWTPDKLDTQLGQLRESGADAVFCSTGPLQAAARFEGEAGIPAMLPASDIPLGTFLCRRGLLESVGNFPEAAAESPMPGFAFALQILLGGFTLQRGTAVLMQRHEAAVPAPTDRLGQIRSGLAVLSQLRVRNEAAEAAVRRRVLELYREQFELLSERKDKAGIRSQIPALNAFLGNPRIGSALANMLFLPSGLYSKFSRWLLSSLLK